MEPNVVHDVRNRVSAEEWQTRVDLAACYRLVAHFGWDDLVFTHITAKVPGSDNTFLINPYGMMFEEISASSLVKSTGREQARYDNLYLVNPAGFTIHSAIHAASHDAWPERQRCRLKRACCRCRSSRSSCWRRSATTTTKGSRCATTRSRGWCAISASVPYVGKHASLTVGPTVADAFLPMHIRDHLHDPGPALGRRRRADHHPAGDPGWCLRPAKW
jgi:ribulose-5-phosphate 4-epimerase/fuculose-1-phosphate aldolase